VAAIVTRHCTAHASDSFLTEASAGALRVVESRASKLVRVEAWRGIISYWGLARAGGWHTLDWLKGESTRAHSHSSPQAFAEHLADQLTLALKPLRVGSPAHRGLGIHFTAYEHIDGHWVPELFAIRNWVAPDYATISTHGFTVTRETYGAVRQTTERSPLDGTRERRLLVHEALRHAPLMLRFCNGDPDLFMPIAHTVLSSFLEMSRRGILGARTA